MIRNLLLILFVATMGSVALGLEFGLAPGLSIKNALLYAIATLIAIEGSIASNRKVELLTVILPFALLIFYATMSWLIIVLFLENPYYQPLPTLVRLKVKLFDQFIVFLVFFYGVVNAKDALWLLKALVWVVVIGCLITVVDTFDIPDLGIITARDKDGRIDGITGSAGEFGGLLAFYVAPIIALWWTATGRTRWLALTGIGLALISLMLSASRGSMLGVVAGAIMATIYVRQYISVQIVVRATVAALLFVSVTVLVVLSTDFGDLLRERLSTGLETGSAETISSGRTAIWTSAFREMSEYPLSFVTGLGWESYYQTIGHRFATHNVYLDRVYNLGIIGLTLFVLPMVTAMATIRRGLDHAASQAMPFLIATIVGMTAFMIAMLFTDLQGSATYMWAYAGVTLRLVVAGSEDGHEHVDVQRRDRPWSRDHANVATRPMSATPRR